MNDPTTAGQPHPLGATVVEGGVNFSIYAKEVQRLELLFFDRAEDKRPSRRVALDPIRNKTYHYWHVFVPNVVPGQLYAYRADLPQLLLDPYARAVAVPTTYSREAAQKPIDNAGEAMKGVVVDRRSYDWEGDRPLRRHLGNSVIYEMHLGGFTQHPNSGLPPSLRGTYRGAIEKIPYLKALGVTAVELLPIFLFDPHDAPQGRINYWGYAPVSFFAPHHGYCSCKDPIGPLREFRDLVKALHKADIEVILDVVYNHTAEGDESGPVLSFKGLSPNTYYLKQGERFANFSGTGNSLNANHSVVKRLIMDSLRFWVQECHVDGFRFDLASILARDEDGQPSKSPPILWEIESDPILAGTKLIAEAWDAGGLYQVGSFIGDSWLEWNRRFRDDIRRFLRGDNGTVRTLADRILGSPDIFAHEQREAEQSINFVTCHDGFTLNDLVSYDHKHNLANGEDNRDGSNENFSWNCGHEGPSQDPAVEALRNQQIRNFLTLNMLSLGTPMLLMGDEVRRTQLGNNNAYCQDNELSWFDWSLVEENSELLDFTRALCQYRLGKDAHATHGQTLNQVLSETKPQFHGIELGQPDWREFSHSLAFTARLPGDSRTVHAMLNAFWEPLDFALPEGTWKLWLDTSSGAIRDWDSPALQALRGRCTVQARSIVILIPL